MTSYGSDTNRSLYPYWPNSGYFDMGPVQVPPTPPRYGVTDRTTGKVWYIGQDNTQGGRIVLFNTLSAFDKGHAQVFNAGDGPTIPTRFGEVQVQMNNGNLVIEYPAPAFASTRSQSPLWARELTTIGVSAPQTNFCTFIEGTSVGKVLPPFLDHDPIHLSYDVFTISYNGTATVLP